MATSLMLQHSTRPLTPHLLKRNVGTSFGLIRGSVGLARLTVAHTPSLEMNSVRLNVACASGKPRDGGEPFDDLEDPALHFMSLGAHLNLDAYINKFSFQRFQIIVMVKWLSSLSQISELKDNPELCNEALDSHESKIKEYVKCEEQMIKSHFDPRAMVNLVPKMDAIYDDILKVFTRYQFECTAEKIDDISFVLMLREIIHLDLYPRIKKIGELLSTMALKKARLLCTDQSCSWENDLVECLAFFGGRLTYSAECALNLPFFAEFSADRQEFVESLHLRCHTQLGAYDLLYKIISTIREFGSILLQCEEEIESYLLDGFLKFSKVMDNEDAIMSDNLLELKNSRSFIMLTEKYFKEIEKDMRRNGRSLTYPNARVNFQTTLGYCISGYNAAIEGIKRLI